MKSFFLTMSLLWLSTCVIGQELQLHNLYWSKGKLVLESQQQREGLTAYIPGTDIVFFKSPQNHAIKTYHISTVAWLSYYDNGVHHQRKFVKMNTEKKPKLFELISMENLHILRLPLKSNFSFEEKSQQYMDKDHRDNRYIYQVALNTNNHEVRFLADEHEKEIARFIHYKKLDCYVVEDQQEIIKFFQNQRNTTFTALSFE